MRLLSAAALILTLAALPATAAADYGFVSQWGGNGSASGQFLSPSGLGSDAAGDVYVADTGSNRIEKFDANGNFLTSFGSAGAGPGQLGQPLDVAASGPSGNVYVADPSNSRIDVFDSNGGFLFQFGGGQVINPVALAIDSSSGEVYVADQNQNRIVKFDAAGNFLLQWGTAGSGPSQFGNPDGVATVGGGVYVSDRDNNRVQRFNSSGNFVSQWGSAGSGDGQFNVPQGMSITAVGDLFVMDQQNSRVQKFDFTGAFTTKFAANGADVEVVPSGDVYVLNPGTSTVTRFREGAPAPPVLGKTVDAQTVTGTVLVKPRGSNTFTRLTAAISVAVGSTLDTRHGTVRITSAADTKGTTQTGDAYQGLFIIKQKATAGATTDFALTGGKFGACKARRASAAAKKKQIRHLWADSKGRFRTVGRYAAASVRGTVWETIDRCDGTLIVVKQGAVTVRDFKRRRNVIVRAGHSYLAKAHR